MRAKHSRVFSMSDIELVRISVTHGGGGKSARRVYVNEVYYLYLARTDAYVAPCSLWPNLGPQAKIMKSSRHRRAC